jgi:hypothetical protein
MLGDALGVELTPAGRLADLLEPGVTRPDHPEERVRQYYGRVLIDEYGYARDGVAFGAPVKKNPHAVALGRKGGLKGGPARAQKLTAKQRSESARKAAKARWKQEKERRSEQGDVGNH